MIKKKKYALLIEPNYPTKVLPFGLQKIATHLLNKNYEVKFIKGLPTPVGFFDKAPNEIYITSLFTYYGKEVIKTIKLCQRLFPKAEIKVGGIFASLMPEYIKKETGIKSHIGLWKEIDNYNPNFSLFPTNEKTTVFTSRGCIRKCKFCAVRKLEPKFEIVRNWKEQVNFAKENNIKKIILQDNNFTASPWSHQKDVIKFFSENQLEVDFQQGLDCRVFSEKHARLYSKLNLPIIRFAFDNIETQDGFIQKAILLMRTYKPHIESRNFVLYNFKDKPEDLWYRFKELNRIGAKAYPMKYAELNSIKRDYIGKYWNEIFLKRLLDFLIGKSKGSMNINYDINSFYMHFGKSGKEFVDIINKHKLKSLMPSHKLKKFDFDI